MKTHRHVIRALQAVVFGTAAVSTALAGCGDLNGLQQPFQFPQSQSAASNANAEARVRAAYSNPLTTVADPIGMWNIQFISQGNGNHNPPIPDGALVDFGYNLFHSDGTEMLNSGAHMPATQNFCMGVWVRTGMFTYTVNHFALSYDATTGALANKVNIREQITLDPSGNEISGTFTITIYDAAGTQQVDQIGGTIAATRVTIDQTLP
jgi:hypothetical protein